AASKNRKYIVSGDDRGKVTVWDVAIYPSWKVGELTGEGKIRVLDTSLDSLRIARGSEDGAVVVRCTDEKERRVGPLKHQGSKSPVSLVRFSPTGSRIASAYYIVGQDNCSIRIWHSHSRALLESLLIAQSTYSIAWSGNGQRLFASGLGGSVKHFDTITQFLLLEWGVSFGDLTTSLCTTHNGQLTFCLCFVRMHKQNGCTGYIEETSW
ncbi:WD40-repeat-containing domain protein, partial [Boletus coccyginus]